MFITIRFPRAETHKNRAGRFRCQAQVLTDPYDLSFRQCMRLSVDHNSRGEKYCRVHMDRLVEKDR